MATFPSQRRLGKSSRYACCPSLAHCVSYSVSLYGSTFVFHRSPARSTPFLTLSLCTARPVSLTHSFARSTAFSFYLYSLSLYGSTLLHFHSFYLSLAHPLLCLCMALRLSLTRSLARSTAFLLFFYRWHPVLLANSYSLPLTLPVVVPTWLTLVAYSCLCLTHALSISLPLPGSITSFLISTHTLRLTFFSPPSSPLSLSHSLFSPCCAVFLVVILILRSGPLRVGRFHTVCAVQHRQPACSTILGQRLSSSSSSSSGGGGGLEPHVRTSVAPVRTHPAATHGL